MKLVCELVEDYENKKLKCRNCGKTKDVKYRWCASGEDNVFLCDECLVDEMMKMNNPDYKKKTTKNTETKKTPIKRKKKATRRFMSEEEYENYLEYLYS